MTHPINVYSYIRNLFCKNFHLTTTFLDKFLRWRNFCAIALRRVVSPIPQSGYSIKHPTAGRYETSYKVYS